MVYIYGEQNAKTVCDKWLSTWWGPSAGHTNRAQMGEALRQNPHFLAKGEKEKQTPERKLC